MKEKNSIAPTVENKFRDIERFNRTVIESSPDCLKILDTEGRLQFMNFNGLCQMEIDDFSPFKNQFWWDLWGRENENLVKQSIATALKGEATEFTAFCNTAKGTPKWWHVTVTPVASETNGIYQLLSISRDITKQKNDEEQLINLNTLLEEKVKIRTEELLEKNIALEKINAELTAFNHVASHDLQEPLRKIQIFSKMILDAENGIDESHTYFKRIIDSTERMRALIDALLKFSISKNITVIPESCDLNSIISEIIDYENHTIEEKQANIEVETLPIIKGSKILLTQLFTNFLTNSLKYSKEGILPHIKFSFEVVASKNTSAISNKKIEEYFAIKIQDNGIGFPMEYKDRIFEIFKRLHSKDEFIGTGVGLAICKSIIEKHEGTVETFSELGIGTTFIIYFPK